MNQRHIAIIWQRFLPYHWARIKQATKRLSELGFQFTPIEVASQDVSYAFPVNSPNDKLNRVCCFPGDSYHDHSAGEVYKKVLKVLNDVKPDIIFAPAIAFPEGIAALIYRRKSEARSVVMDDAWEFTDRRNVLVKLIKKLVYKNADAAFIPAASHLPYYMRLGFTKDRIVFGVDVVDNEYFAKHAKLIRSDESKLRNSICVPHNFFLFVGRILPRKGLETLLEAYKQYRGIAQAEEWDLVIVGTGNHLDALHAQLNELSGVYFAGAQFGDNLCKYYSLAKVLIVPSASDPWGLVVNEGMASGLPVIVSTGCGAAKNLVREGGNGWTFSPGDAKELTQLMLHVSSLPADALERMGEKSRSIIADWSLERFADGVLKAIGIPRRKPAGLISDILTRLWKGRISTA